MLWIHWAKKARMIKADAATIVAYAAKAGLPKNCETRQRVGMTIVLKPKQRACDPDSQWKNVLDGLRKFGAIVDDSRTWLELEPVKYERGTVETWGTRITVGAA